MRSLWRRLGSGMITGALCGSLAAVSAVHGLHPRSDQFRPSPAQVRMAATVQLVSYDSSGGGGTGGSGGAASQPLRLRAMSWAHHQEGCWYQWGGTGPCSQGFDCSGLVYKAYLAQGVNIGRDTYEMLGNPHLHRIPQSQARRGDLAFYGSGHVELVWQPRWHRTFGAHDSGSRIGSIKWGAGWHPTAFYRIEK